MKFTANSKEFEKLLAKVIPAAPQRTPMQILENFLFTVEGGSLTVMATDLEISLSAAMDVGADEDASFAVPAKLLHDFVRTLGDASIEFSTTSDDRLRLKTDFGEYAIAYQPPDEFPKAPERENDGEIVLDGKRLRRAFEKTSFAISREAMRPAMTGELVELSDEGMRFVATDGLRLARYHDPKVTFDGARQLVIPEKAVVALQKLAGDGEAKMTFGETIVSFDLGDLTMTSRLIKHRYPDYSSVIPLANENEMTIKRSELSATVKRMFLFSSSSFQQVRLTIDKENLKVSARDQDKGSNAEENITCAYNGDPMEIGFNSGYLADALSHFDADEATFKMHSPTKAAIIVPADPDAEGAEDLLMLLMPMRLNEDR